MKSILIVFVCIIWGGLIGGIQAQTSEIKGSVVDETGEGVISATAFIESLKMGALTNELGVFSLARIPAGTYKLRISSIGYDTIYQEVTLTAGKLLKLSFTLKERATVLEEVVITDDAIGKIDQNKVKAGETKITSRQIKLMPSLGSPDLAQYLQVVPGVITSGDQGGQLFVRGGTPIQNLVMLDGMIIYNPFHSIGVFSVFDPDILKSTDVYSAGYSAEYGGRVSSVMDIRTRTGNLNRLSGKVHTNPFTNGFLIEGPLSKTRNTGSGTSFLLSYRESRLESTSERLYKSLTDSLGLPYRFRDIYGKITFTGGGNRLSLFGFNNSDDVNFEFPSDVSWSAYGGGMQFQYLPSLSKVILTGNIAYSGYKTQLNSQNEVFPRRSNIGGLNSFLNFSYIIRSIHELSYGVQVFAFNTDFNFTNAYGYRVVQKENNTEMATYLKYRQVFKRKNGGEGSALKNRAVIEPGVRMHFYSDKSTVSLEPRLKAKLNFNRISFYGATGIYSQNLISSNSDLDIVNFFQGIILAPDNVNNPLLKNNLQSAIHYLGGTEIELFENFETTVEVWHKDFRQLTAINRFKLFSSDPDFIAETSSASGLDIAMKYDYKQWYVSLNYGIARINRNDGIQTYPASFDRRHNANLIISWNNGNVNDRLYKAKEATEEKVNIKPRFEASKWELGLRWTLGSGFPFTQTQGFYERLTTNTGGAQTPWATQNGNLGILYSTTLNGGRLPYFHRLDLSAKKRWQFGNKFLLEINASVYNTYNRDNIFYIDRIRYVRVNQLPLIPSAGAQLSF